MPVLRPIVDHLTTWLPASTRAMGYDREISGIRRRYLRVKDHWADHVEHCRAVIRPKVDKLRKVFQDKVKPE